MKRKILVSIIFCIGLFFINSDVFAKINTKNTEIECIYGNGVVAGLNYDSSTKKIGVYIKDYPVTKTSTIDGDPITNISFFKDDIAINGLEGLSCPKEIRYWKVWEYTNVDKTDKKFRGVYAFDWCTDKSSDCVGVDATITLALRQTKQTGWFIFTGEEEVSGTVPVTGTNLIKQGTTDPDAPEAIIPLVGERLYIVDDIGDDAYSQTFKLYSSDAQQAVGTNKYAQVYVSDNNEYFLHVGDTITSIAQSAEVFNSQYICIAESIVTEDASRGDSSKKFSRIRHNVAPSTETETCPSGQKYVRTTEVCKVSTGNTAGSFCDKYPNTAFVLIDIIKVMQILVPALVIVFTGIEIGRIVIAGNIEEELPKRKKSIIIRLIVMIAFLFLPIITQLIISLAEGVSILDVSCLFNDGKETTTETLTDQNCEDAIKDSSE